MIRNRATLERVKWVMLAGIALYAAADTAFAQTITNTFYRSLYYCENNVQASGDCGVETLYISDSYSPNLPPEAIITNYIAAGIVDDKAILEGKDSITIGGCNSSSYSNNLTAIVNPDGSFDLQLYDKTSEGTNGNRVLLTGELTITCILTNPLPQDISPTNVERELCVDCEDRETANCSIEDAGCEGCNEHGNPKPSFSIGNFEIQVSDTPIWHETAVGPALSLDMNFSNYSDTNANRTFGAKWACNWNSSIWALNTGTNVFRFPSGSLGPLVFSTNGVYTPSASLNGYTEFSSSTYRFHKPNGWVWQYAPSQGNSNFYLLDSIWDVWSNTVVLTYTNDRIYRVTQTVPNTGRYLEFGYNGTNAWAISVSTEPGASRTAYFSYSADGSLTGVVDMAGNGYAYQYTNGYLSRIQRAGTTNVRLNVTYSPTPNAWTVTNTHWIEREDGAGIKRKYTWEFGAICEVDSLGTNTYEKTYGVRTLDGRGPVILNMVNSLGIPETFQYGSNGRVTNQVDRTGASISRAFNSQHRVASYRDQLGYVTAYTYASNGVDLLYTTPPTGPVQRVLAYVPDRHVLATESNAMGEVISYAYNSLGLLTNKSNGRITEAYTYNSEGRLLARYRNGELMATNAYDAWGRLSWTRDAAGLTVSNTYDNLNRLQASAFNNKGLVSTQIHYYGCCFLDAMTDRRGKTWNYTYNEAGQKLSESNPKGLTTYSGYELSGNPALVSNTLERTKRSYSKEGWLTRIEYPARAFDNSHAENFWYDPAGRMIKRQDISGAFFKFDFNAAGRQTGAYVPDGQTLAAGVEKYVQAESNRYDSLGRKTWTRDIRGLEKSLSYNALGLLTNTLYPDASTERWTFNKWGDLTVYKDRTGNLSSNAYDTAGRLVQQKDARGNSLYFSYTNGDFISAVSNGAMGLVWRYEYDAEGRMVTVTEPDGSQETRAYDALGNVTQIVKGGITTAFVYDELGNRTSVDMDGDTVETNGYDGLGRLLSTVNADGLSITNAWDSWGKINKRYWPGGLLESYQYGDRGLTNAIDRLAIPVRYVRDSLGRLNQQIDGATNPVSYAYLSNGIDQVTSLWDGNSNKTAWAYDKYGNPTNKVYADGSQEFYRYDGLNRLTNKMDAAGITTGYGYDQNGNLVSIKYGALSPVTFGYDALNRRTNMTDTVGTTVWTYDSLGRVTSEKGPFGTNTVNVKYDSLGRMTNLAFGPYSAGYMYDSKGRITGVQASEGSYSFAYLADGIKRTSASYPNGVIETRAYDSLKRLTNLVYSSSTSTLISISYGFDNGDRRTNEAWNTGRSASYSYDRAYQLLGASSTARPSDNVSYLYDKSGNPLRRVEMGLTRDHTFNNLNQFVSGTWTGKLIVAGELNYSAGTVTVNGMTGQIFPDRTFEVSNITVAPGSNLITAIYTGPAFTNTAMIATSKVSVTLGNPAFGYDSKGNLTNDAEFVYQFDLANRLTNAVRKSSDASVLSSRYDGLGRRVEVTRNGTTVERYVYFPGSFLVLSVLDGSNQIKEVWSRGPDLNGGLDGEGGIGGILSVSTNIGTAFASKDFHADELGNIVLVTGSAGQQIAHYRFSPFGKIVGQIGDYQARYAFSSKEFDPETGLIYYGHRFYNPTMGRWLSRDSLGEWGGENLYGFVFNNPVFWLDYIGMEPMPHAGSKSYRDYIQDIFITRYPRRDKSKDQRRVDSYKRGCVGIVCINTGKPGWPEQDSTTECYKSKTLAEVAVRNKQCLCTGKGVDAQTAKPEIFSIHLNNNRGIDPSKPDVTEDPSGKVDMSNWDHKQKPGYFNFDYGFLNPNNYVEHANHLHGPAYANDPSVSEKVREAARALGPMEVYTTKPDDWTQFMHSDFNKEVWCVICNEEKH